MGPRSIDRGTGEHELVFDKYFLLQWGRDQLIAGLTDPPENRLTEPTLQWGRDQLIAGLPYRFSSYGFVVMLQWGRDQLIAGLAPQSYDP